jgi:alanine-glyoxylate transaminase/serine-glyoxylate transaminase/serine-pyruvate transaminase
MADYVYGPGRNHLFVPGPVNIPDPVIRAMNRQNEDYRSPAIPALTKILLEDVKKIFKTTMGTPFLIPTTGTGAWESALTNTLSPGDRIVSFLIGQFSLLWIDQQQRLGFNVDVVESDWGHGADLAALERKLRMDTRHTIKAVAIVHNETATGVTNDLAAVRRLLDAYAHPALLLVDGVSSICALDFRMDEWGVDVALTGSQKALSMPTGMGIVCASPKALEASKTARSVRVFFDWKDFLKFYEMGTYWPYTPSIQLLYGLRTALDLIFEEGLDNVIKRHNRLGTATRYGGVSLHACPPGARLTVMDRIDTLHAYEMQVCRGGMGAQELLPEGGVFQRHRHGRRRAALHRQRRDCQARVEAVQPQPRPRPQQGRREGLQDRPSRQPQRGTYVPSCTAFCIVGNLSISHCNISFAAATAGMPERRGDGAQGRGVPGEARQRRRTCRIPRRSSRPGSENNARDDNTKKAGDDDERADKQTNKACSAEISASAPCRADGCLQ